MEPLPGRNIQIDVHDAVPLQLYHLVTQVFAHASDLPVEPLGKDDFEGKLICLLHETFLCYYAQEGYPVAHFFTKVPDYYLNLNYQILIYAKLPHRVILNGISTTKRCLIQEINEIFIYDIKTNIIIFVWE